MIRLIFTLVALFLFIYAPPFQIFPVNVSVLLAFFAYIYLLWSGVFLRVLLVFKYEASILLIICMYSLLCSIRSGDLSLLYSPFILLFANLPVCIWLFFIIKNLAKDSGEQNIHHFLIRLLGVVGGGAALLSIFLAYYSDIGYYAKFVLMKYDAELLRYQMHRGFGLADELLFSYSLVQGGIALLILQRYNFSFSSVILSFLMFVSIALNARIGLVLLFFVPFILGFRFKIIVYFLVWCGGGVLVYELFISGFSVPLINTVVDQIVYFYNDLSVSDMSSSYGFDSTLVVLLRDMFFLPDSAMKLIFGSGENIFYKDIGGSDSGFVIMLHYGGVFYLSLFIAFVVLCFYRSCRFSGGIFPAVLILFIMIVANIKGLFFAAKPGMHFFLLLYVFTVGCDFLCSSKASKSHPENC